MVVREPGAAFAWLRAHVRRKWRVADLCFLPVDHGSGGLQCPDLVDQQHHARPPDSPGKDKESNWLPAPKEPFYMLMRMYLPKIEVLNEQYEIPGVVKSK